MQFTSFLVNQQSAQVCFGIETFMCFMVIM